jgi:hypothetical protein
VNGFGPARIEKSHFKRIFGCIFRQSLMKYGGKNFRYSNKKKIVHFCIYRDVVSCLSTYIGVDFNFSTYMGVDCN